MGTRKFNALKWFFIAVPAVWGVLAFVAWHEVAQCGPMFGPRCSAVYREGIIRFTSLSWVWEYQTLVAGVLAFAAGAFAYYSAVIKIRHQEATNRQKRQNEQLKCCTALLMDCLLASIFIRNNNDEDTKKRASTLLSTFPHPQMSTIYDISYELGALTLTVQTIAHFHKQGDERRRKIVAAQCHVLSEIFTRAKSDLETIGHFDLSSCSISPSKDLMKLMNEWHLTPSELEPLTQFLE